MSQTPLRPLDAEALALFARKGFEAGPQVPQAGEANAAKVRRVLQLTRDLTGSALDTLRILDLGCGEGAYAIEAAVHGARVVAIDARTERMQHGAACAARHGLANVEFIERDVRDLDAAALGRFDVVWLLGLLYHLDAPDVFKLIERAFALCTRVLVVDTFVSDVPTDTIVWRAGRYAGERRREHEDADPPEVRRGRVLRSIDNTFAFRFTYDALLRVLRDTGFSSVYETRIPAEPGKPAARITLAAIKGTPVTLSTYPWINGMTDDELEQRLRDRSTGADLL